MRIKLKKLFLLQLFYLFILGYSYSQTVADERIDNLKYWNKMIKLGLAKASPDVKPPASQTVSSKITSPNIISADYADVPITTEPNTTQSENSVFVNSNNGDIAINANNSTGNPSSILHGVSNYKTTNQSENWQGDTSGINNSDCDPSTVIGNDGRYYIGYIDKNNGQSISYSTNNGATWTPAVVSTCNNGVLDKNHLWIDNSVLSPYNGHLYDAWTDFYGTNSMEIEFSRSTNRGVNWSSDICISQNINAGSHNQGVNIQTGPNGEVYVVWAVYDSWPADESALGFTRSFNGGTSFDSAVRIISNIRGIRMTTSGKNMRVNSYPSMTVDNSGGPNNGNIYVVWTNVGTPGNNTGTDVDIYLIKSVDHGDTWSAPLKVNQDQPGLGKKHYFPWITCDQSNGALYTVFYDDRYVSSTQVQTFVASSFDGGATWQDFRVSDVTFTPTPIPGLAYGYFGDYIGITAKDGIVYPVWTDNRTGKALSYCSPFAAGCMEDIVLINRTVEINEHVEYDASNSISAAGDNTFYTLKGNGSDGCEAIFRAGNIINLKKGFVVQKGAYFNAYMNQCNLQTPVFKSTNYYKSDSYSTDNQDIENSNNKIGNVTITVLPNPASESIVIQIIENNEITNIRNIIITDLMGKVVYMHSGKEPDIKVDVSSLSKGVYILKIYENRNLIDSRKILLN